MEKPEVPKISEVGRSKERSVLRKIAFAGLALFVFAVVSAVAAIAYNNISLWSDASFSSRLDLAIGRGEEWIGEHRTEILKKKNAALLTMLRECNDIRPNPVFGSIVTSFLNEPITHHSRCWKHEIDLNWPVDKQELNMTIAEENTDNKWALYAIAPNEAEVDPEKLGLFDNTRWHRRQLTHQVFALTMLRNRHGSSDGHLDELTENLCERLRGNLNLNIAVVDIYIQRVAFVLRAGFPQKIRRRWVERIIANQQSDGGWNDRWLCFTTTRRKLVFGIGEMPSDQHATVQAVLALYLVKCRYPEQFGLQ